MTKTGLDTVGPLTSQVIWCPTQELIRSTGMDRFRLFCEERSRSKLGDYAALHAWSIAEPDAFWDALWDFTGIVGEKGAKVFVPSAHIRDARFFPEARLNFAENLLWKRGNDDAIVFWAEDKDRRRVSWDDLRAQVSRLQRALRDAGVESGDRVVGLLPNIPEAIAFMLATTSLGAVWCSASPDFGVAGVIDRFGQIAPKVLFTCDGYWYAGKTFPILSKIREIVGKLPSLTKAVVVTYIGAQDTLPDEVTSLEAFVASYPEAEPTFERFPFDHPLYILFSSGTTGFPKCIVHRVGALLQHAKEHRLHADIREGDRVYYFTTLSWMMWNWLASVLACGSTVMLYDGSPFHPKADIILDYAQAECFTLLGTSPKYIDALRKSEMRPKDTHDLAALRTILSTGSPLAPVNYGWVYDAIKSDQHLSSISGGTDIVGCFVLADPTGPARIGEIEVPSLGLAVEIWDETGKSVGVGVKGELVCTNAFPSMPLGFWNDRDGERYLGAYFTRFGGVWHHGDFAERTSNGGFVIHGRSDATLNPGGVRIGTAEIYAQVDKIDEVSEALAVGQTWDYDTRVILFVRLKEEAVFDDALRQRIRTAIRTGATPRHVPALIIAVPDMPRTKSGKVVELAVRDIVNGREVGGNDALANPESLEHFRNIPELRWDCSKPSFMTGHSDASS